MQDFSIIIVNYNTKELLYQCLQSLKKSIKNTHTEIIVIDNNSSDNSVPFVRKLFPEIILIENDKNLGFGKACNQGINISRGKYIILLNSDCEVFKNTLSTIKKIISNFSRSDRIGIIGGKILNPDGTLQFSYGKFPTVFSNILDLFKPPPHRKVQTSGYDSPHYIDWVTGAFMMINRKLFTDIGYFDENYFMYYEETDICFRAKAQGWQILYDPSPQVIHKIPHSTKKDNIPLFIQAEIRKSHLYFFRKNRSYLSYFTIFLASFILLVLKWCRYVFQNTQKRKQTAALISVIWITFKKLTPHNYRNNLNCV